MNLNTGFADFQPPTFFGETVSEARRAKRRLAVILRPFRLVASIAELASGFSDHDRNGSEVTSFALCRFPSERRS